MLHDITFCTGSGCPIRDSCRRYSTEALSAKHDGVLLAWTDEMYQHGQCPMYYEY